MTERAVRLSYYRRVAFGLKPWHFPSRVWTFHSCLTTLVEIVDEG